MKALTKIGYTEAMAYHLKYIHTIKKNDNMKVSELVVLQSKDNNTRPNSIAICTSKYVHKIEQVPMENHYSSFFGKFF